MDQENYSISQKDLKEINEIVSQFFDLFTNIDGRIPNVRKIKHLFLRQGILINNTAEEPLIYDLESFIIPREKILTDGTLTDFVEKEISHTTDIHGNIARRKCFYEKSGKLNGEFFKGEGVKFMQLLKIDNKWFLSAVTWWDNK